MFLNLVDSYDMMMLFRVVFVDITNGEEKLCWRSNEKMRY